eukprot:COSAG05_NODE_716_length_7804_cov_2.669825_7_plen_149_part_00
MCVRACVYVCAHMCVSVCVCADMRVLSICAQQTGRQRGLTLRQRIRVLPRHFLLLLLLPRELIMPALLFWRRRWVGFEGKLDGIEGFRGEGAELLCDVDPPFAVVRAWYLNSPTRQSVSALIKRCTPKSFNSGKMQPLDKQKEAITSY